MTVCCTHREEGTCASLRRAAAGQCRTGLWERPHGTPLAAQQTAESPEETAYCVAVHNPNTAQVLELRH